MEVEVGFDLFMTTQTTEVDLSDFGLGVVPLEGDDSFFGIPGVDTIVARLEPAGVPDVGNSMAVDIELVALSLVSVDPVDLGTAGFFDLHVVGGSLELPQLQGEMTINRLDPNGGTFQARLPVDTLLHFFEVGGDGSNDFIQPFQDEFNSQGVWSHTPRSDSCFPEEAGGFFPGVDPITMDKVPTVEEAALATHTVIPCMKMPVGGEFIGIDTTSVLVAGAQYTAAWMIPVIVSAIGIAIVIARKF
jgi:hypothetical protein